MNMVYDEDDEFAYAGIKFDEGSFVVSIKKGSFVQIEALIADRMGRRRLKSEEEIVFHEGDEGYDAVRSIGEAISRYASATNELLPRSEANYLMFLSGKDYVKAIFVNGVIDRDNACKIRINTAGHPSIESQNIEHACRLFVSDIKKQCDYKLSDIEPTNLY